MKPELEDESTDSIGGDVSAEDEASEMDAGDKVRSRSPTPRSPIPEGADQVDGQRPRVVKLCI